MTEAGSSGPVRPAGTPGRVTRRAVVLAALVLAVLLLALGGLPWVRGEAATVIGVRPVSVTGAGATPALTAAALVVGAAALTVAIGRRVAVAVGGVVLVGAAALVAAAVAGFLQDPTAPALAEAAQVSGAPQLSGAAHVTPWPWVALVVAAALALLGVLTLVRGRSWQSGGRRFERTTAPRDRGPERRPDAARDARTQAMDDWDALGRGEDPSGPDDATSGEGDEPPCATLSVTTAPAPRRWALLRRPTAGRSRRSAATAGTVPPTWCWPARRHAPGTAGGAARGGRPRFPARVSLIPPTAREREEKRCRRHPNPRPTRCPRPRRSPTTAGRRRRGSSCGACAWPSWSPASA